MISRIMVGDLGFLDGMWEGYEVFDRVISGFEIYTGFSLSLNGQIPLF